MDEMRQPTKITSRKGLGEILIEAGQLTAEQLEKAMKLQQKQHGKLGEILIELKLVSPEKIAAALSNQLNMPLIDLKRYLIQPKALQLVPEKLARKYTLIPLDITDDALVVVMADPGDIRAIEEITAQTKIMVQPAVGIPSDIREAIDLHYKATGEIEKQMEQFPQAGRPLETVGSNAVEDVIAQTPVVRTVDLLIGQALKSRASDIHIEPQRTRVRVRYRIDGVLHDAMSLPQDTIEPLISRIKILGGMDITERRRPQDGQFSFKANGREADIRAATFETEHGETAVLRILDKSLPLFTLPQLGLSSETLKKYQGTLNSPYGMILVAGPTGSGKTTTLYASLNQLNRDERNIVTIEEPIEYHFTDIKQSQINPKAGITFASGLRSIMRLDPDIILVGEIRDPDTANISVQAALTGHLVLSSIHANDSIGVLFRLMNLGVESYLICSALVAVVAQRIVRRICYHCREPYQPTEEERLIYEREMGEKKADFYHGAGCNLCAGTGYLMRTAIFEVLTMSDGVRRLLLHNASVDDLKAQAIKEGMISLRQAGIMKVREDVTTIQEILRNSFSIS
ncbi:MAG: pilus assembly protein PilB [Chloroflexi bacterium]|nr:pilus assembly protein PilB [Chloroflexota bacterium]